MCAPWKTSSYIRIIRAVAGSAGIRPSQIAILSDRKQPVEPSVLASLLIGFMNKIQYQSFHQRNHLWFATLWFRSKLNHRTLQSITLIHLKITPGCPFNTEGQRQETLFHWVSFRLKLHTNKLCLFFYHQTVRIPTKCSTKVLKPS